MMEVEVTQLAHTLLEKLDLKDEKNILIQGLPSTVEKQFSKISFAKNLTPLLKMRKVDFALVFAINQCQLNGILNEVVPSLQKDAKLWVGYPKKTSKIVSDLSRDCKWEFLAGMGLEGVHIINVDHVWSAMRFKKTETIKRKSAGSIVEGIDYEKRTVIPPADLENLLTRNRTAKEVFDKLAFSHKKEYVEWITGAKKEETRKARLEKTIEKLSSGKKKPSEK